MLDTPENSHTIGHEYIGLLYKFCIYQYAYSSWTTEFPVNCGVSETVGCESCLESCTQGCIRPSDCRLCEDYLCDNCTIFSGECQLDGCITNTQLTNGICTCDAPNHYLSDIDACTTCLPGCAECSLSVSCDVCMDGFYLTESLTCDPCHEGCSVCEDATSIGCSACAEGFALQPGTLKCD